jgi:hypothetical protein
MGSLEILPPAPDHDLIEPNGMSRIRIMIRSRRKKESGVYGARTRNLRRDRAAL